MFLLTNINAFLLFITDNNIKTAKIRPTLPFDQTALLQLYLDETEILSPKPKLRRYGLRPSDLII